MDAAAVLAHAQDRILDEAVAALAERDRAAHRSPGPQECRRNVSQLFGLVLRCVRAGRAEPIGKPAEQIAAHCFASGIDLAEIQGEVNVLTGVLRRHLAGALPVERQVQALWLLADIAGAGKDAMARTYLALAGQGGADAPSVPAAAPSVQAAAPVGTAMVGKVGIITLDDPDKRNAIGARMASGVVAALGSLRTQDARAIVLRAAAGTHVWSAGHDIDELPRGRRDPLGYDNPLEELIRVVRTYPAPVIAMVHGTVWGGALDLVLSCDLVVADETAAFAITPANLGLPYNITGLLHFMGRLPINAIKEMFFTATPIDARKAREWLLVNHLVPWDRLESFTLELAATMATKSPLAIAVIKEQLRVLSDYQPIAAQVYERIQGLRRQAYDSSDYLEGLDAFAHKRQPIFKGT